MFSSPNYKYFVDHQFWHLMGAIQNDLDQNYNFGKKSDLWRYVVIDLFERIGYASQHVEANGKPGWVITERGLAELRELMTQDEDEDEDVDVDVDEDDDEGEDEHELADNSAQVREAKGKTETH